MASGLGSTVTTSIMARVYGVTGCMRVKEWGAKEIKSAMVEKCNITESLTNLCLVGENLGVC